MKWKSRKPSWLCETIKVMCARLERTVPAGISNGYGWNRKEELS
jgi:hypothetical protein